MTKTETRMAGNLLGGVFKIPLKRGFRTDVVLAISLPEQNDEVEVLFVELNPDTTGKHLLPLSEKEKKLYYVHLRSRTFIIRKLLGKKIFDLSESDLQRVLKELVLIEAERYYHVIHEPEQQKAFVPGKTRLFYSGRVYDFLELSKLIDSSLEFYLTAGRYDKEFCEKLSSFLSEGDGKKLNVVTVNSGSSANLLAIASLTSYKLGRLALQEGDEVITVAAGFPTTVAPLFQHKLVPVFVDVELGSYNINPHLIAKAVTNKTKALFIAHTLGIPFDMDTVLEVAEKHGLWLVEDNCDALGATYMLRRQYQLIKGLQISGRRYTGTFGHIGTSSFYPAHQITMGEGGALYTYDEELRKIILSFRDWGRDCWCGPGCDNSCGRRFSWELGNLPKGYDHKYIYSHMGYNLKITDLQAAIGSAQMEKLGLFALLRKKNWHRLKEGLQGLENFFILPCYPENAEISPFGFALTVRESAGFSRNEITSFLERHQIQTRVIFTGNVLQQPAIVNGNYKFRIAGILENTESIMNHTFWIGVYPGLTESMIDYAIAKIKAFVKG